MQINLDTVLNEDITEKIQKLEDYSGVKFPESYIGFIKNIILEYQLLINLSLMAMFMLLKDFLVL